MAVRTDAELMQDVIDYIRSSHNDTSAAGFRTVLQNFIDSKKSLNSDDIPLFGVGVADQSHVSTPPPVGGVRWNANNITSPNTITKIYVRGIDLPFSDVAVGNILYLYGDGYGEYQKYAVTGSAIFHDLGAGVTYYEIPVTYTSGTTSFSDNNTVIIRFENGSASGGGAVWGTITGNIADQIDLAARLDPVSPGVTHTSWVERIFNNVKSWVASGFSSDFELAKQFGFQQSVADKRKVILPSGDPFLHGSVIVGNYVYFGVRPTSNSSPGRIVKMQLDRIDIYTVTTFGGATQNSCEVLTYVPSKGKIYIAHNNSGNNLYVTEYDPVTEASTIVISDTSVGYRMYFPASVSDGTYLYVSSGNQTAGGTLRVRKYRLSDFAYIGELNTGLIGGGHSLKYDGYGNLYLTTTYRLVAVQQYIVQIDLSTFAVVTSLAIGGESYTDDMAIIGDYIYCGQEYIYTTASVLTYARIKKDLSGVEYFTFPGITGTCFGMIYADGFLWCLGDTTPGNIIRINPQTLEVAIYATPTGEGRPNELLFDGKNYYVSFWQDPAVVVMYNKFAFQQYGKFKPGSPFTYSDFALTVDVPAAETTTSILTKIGDGTKISSTYLPSYVDDVIEVADFASLPVTGESGKIYVTDTPYTSGGVTSSQFRWSGSAYAAIIASPGTTDAVTEGSTNLYFTAARVRAAVMTGISFVTATAVTAADNLLVAVGKLQAQIDALVTSVTTNTTNITTLFSSKDNVLAPSSVKTSNYTASANEGVRTDTTSNNVQVTLPSAPADKTRIGVKQVTKGTGFTTTIVCGGSDVFNKTGGATTFNLALLAQGAILQYYAAVGVWVVVAADIPLSQLDARFAAIRIWQNVTWVTATTIDLVGNSFFKNITAVTGNQTITYNGGASLGSGETTMFQINKTTASNISIILPSTSVIFLDISPSEASFAANVVTLNGASGAKYLFQVRDANGDMVTLISKIASDSVANSPKIFYSSNAILPWSGIAGATINTDAIAFTISVPANTLVGNSSWRVIWQCLGGASTNSKTFKLYDQTLGATNGLILSSQNSVAIQLINKEVIMTCHTAATQTISQTNITGTEVTKAIDFNVARILIGSINISNTTESASAFKSVLIVQTN